MGLRNNATRFGWVAITLHWVLAAAILFMVYLGLYMTDAEDYEAYQLHKSLGITILALSLLRLIWRFVDPPPPLPTTMPAWEKFAAHASHWGFYALMIGIPLSGWLYVSASPNSDFVTTNIWGVFDLPLIPPLPTLENREDLADTFEDAHGWLAIYALLGLAGLHVLAALKHHFWDRDRVLHAMAPVIPNPERDR